MVMANALLPQADGEAAVDDDDFLLMREGINNPVRWRSAARTLAGRSDCCRVVALYG